MLINNLYSLSKVNCLDNELTANISIDAKHEIFNGHFPGQPIVPGVCMIQMIKEVLEDQVGKKLFLNQGNQMKFLHPVNPLESKQLSVSIKWKLSDGKYETTAHLENEEKIVFKFQGVLKIVE